MGTADVVLGAGIGVCASVIASILAYLLGRRQSRSERYFDLKFPLYRDFMSALQGVTQLYGVMLGFIEIRRKKKANTSQDVFERIALISSLGALSTEDLHVMDKLERKSRTEKAGNQAISDYLERRLVFLLTQEGNSRVATLKQAEAGLQVLSAPSLDSAEHTEFWEAMAPIILTILQDALSHVDDTTPAPKLENLGEAISKAQAAHVKFFTVVKKEMKMELG